ncbi:MAG: hypothetical protein RR678_11180 [Lachnospiraceae bacterium]
MNNISQILSRVLPPASMVGGERGVDYGKCVEFEPKEENEF